MFQPTLRATIESDISLVANGEVLNVSQANKKTITGILFALEGNCCTPFDSL
jgi:hypothetical protein